MVLRTVSSRDVGLSQATLGLQPLRDAAEWCCQLRAGKQRWFRAICIPPRSVCPLSLPRQPAHSSHCFLQLRREKEPVLLKG